MRNDSAGSSLSRRTALRTILVGGMAAGWTAACGRGSGGVAGSHLLPETPHRSATLPAPGTLVMIIRHGEKPSKGEKGYDENGTKDKKSLTRVGYQRAAALATLFDPPAGRSPRPGLARPKALFAADATSEGEGKRTRETLTPLATALGLPVDTTFGKGQEDALVAKVVSQPGPTLICWQHGEIPAIAAAFGALTPAPPSDWPDQRYDVIWTLTATATGWTFAQQPELLLPGDQPSVITSGG